MIVLRLRQLSGALGLAIVTAGMASAQTPDARPMTDQQLRMIYGNVISGCFPSKSTIEERVDRDGVREAEGDPILRAPPPSSERPIPSTAARPPETMPPRIMLQVCD